MNTEDWQGLLGCHVLEVPPCSAFLAAEMWPPAAPAHGTESGPTLPGLSEDVPLVFDETLVSPVIHLFF